MPSLVDIYNIALSLLGAGLIADPDDLQGNAKILAARYPDIRDAVLRAHPWNCAIEYANLAAEGDAPLFAYDYQYKLPTDPYCLRALKLVELPNVKWIVKRRRLLTDQSGPLPLCFIGQVTDPAEFDSLLVQAIGTRLAAVCAWKITKKEVGTAQMKIYKDVLAEAKSIDGQEGWPDEGYFESEILEARE